MPGWVGVGRRFQPEGTVCAKATRREELRGVGEQKGPRARMASSLRGAEDPDFILSTFNAQNSSNQGVALGNS